ncbi:alpha/beta fold hydrolase [Maricaulis sp.]|uniref:S9 family peptidase n=1 Tax=Maricaulis sp. TaxID=1486257 RepID=UPI002B26F25A|nr:alpha/beta fold hydrolase [Maricaulis sp.]
MSVFRATLVAVLGVAALFATMVGPVGAQRIPSMGDGAIEDFLRHVIRPPRYENVRLSPNGRYLLLVEKPHRSGGDDTILVYDLDSEGDSAGRRVSVGNRRVDWVEWANDDRFLIAISARNVRVTLRRERGRYQLVASQSRVLTIDRDSLQRVSVLFDGEGENFWNPNRSPITDFLPDDPDHILMPSYERRNYNLYRVNIETGAADRVERGDDATVAWFSANGEAVMRVDRTRSGEHLRFHARTGRNGRWRRVNTVRTLDLFDARANFEWAGPSDRPGEIYVRARPDGSEFYGIYRYDLAEDVFLEPVAVRDDYDIDYALIDEDTGRYYGYSYAGARRHFVFADPAFAAGYADIRRQFPEDVIVEPVSLGANRMVVYVSGATLPGVYYLHDAGAGVIDELVAVNSDLVADSLQPMQAISYTARDGTEIPAFLTEPATGSISSTPLVVMPHGGPEARDEQGFDPVVQYLAAQGYTVFQPNYRGSSGYGRAYAEAGYRQWGRLMQDDLTDGVAALVERGQADPDQVCIVGFSYGGYAALIGAALTPELYRCAFAGAPVADVEEFLEFKEDAGDEVHDYWVELLGHPRRDRDFMRETSPVRIADRIDRPVYLLHGDADRVVPVEQSRVMAAALEAADADFVYEEVSGLTHNWGEGRDFIVTMRNLAAFLDDAMDGRIDSFDPNANKDE